MDIRRIIEEEALLKEAEEGDLKALAGLDVDQPIDAADAQQIGTVVAQMQGDRLDSYLSMMAALGGYYSGSDEETDRKLDRFRQIMFQAYNDEREDQEQGRP